MPATLSYPGVYIEEISSGVHTITGVATSITAFIGRTRRGQTNVAETINNFGDFERGFGGLWLQSSVSFAVRDFYLNGGSQAIIVRLFHGGQANADDQALAKQGAEAVATAAKGAADLAGAKTAATAASKTIQEDAAAKEPKKTAASAVATAINAMAKGTKEEIAALADTTARRAAAYAKARLVFGTMALAAAEEGSWGANLRAEVDLDNITAASLFNLTVRDSAPAGAVEKFLNVSTEVNSPRRADRVLEAESSLVRWDGDFATAPPNIKAIRDAIDTLKDDPTDAHQDALWTLTNDLVTQRQKAYARAKAAREKAENEGSDATALKAAEATALTAYNNELQVTADAVTDGNNLAVTDFLPPGGEVEKKGLFAFEQVDLFNLLCIPPYKATEQPLDVDFNLLSVADAYCVKRRAMLIVDPPKPWKSKTIAHDAFINPSNAIPRSQNSAIFFPRLKQPNLLRDNQVEEFAPCGTVAGVFARTDTQRGVWKAPAGLDASLAGVPELSVNLTDAENGELNPLGINCLRAFPAAGRVVWGSRTLRGSDQLADEYKYIPVRRTALFIEESLYRGTQWVVFEPNDEPLWAQIRLNVGAFMQNLFRQGAFQGKTPREAYLVKCDSETTTQNDINLGIVNIIVGFAPLKPAEFVIIKLQQLAGQIEV
jgi:uncharacterized protein